MNSVRKLSRRIQNLVPLLVMLTLALLVLVPAPAGAVDKFIIGDRVVVNNADITVRTMPTEGGSPGTLLGQQALGVQGTVRAGPITAAIGATYWEIDFVTGLDIELDGWSAEQFLDKAPPAKFIIGDRVVVNNADITVRTMPTEGGSPGTLLGQQALGVQGTVRAGPITAAIGATYWEIDFVTGLDIELDGWSAEQFLDKAPIQPSPPPRADLALSLTDIPDPLTVNGQLTYTITVKNNSPGIATGVRVEDFLPPGALLARPASSSQGECSGVVNVVCNLGTLVAAGAQATVTINVIPTVPGDLSNTATVAAFEDDPNDGNNSNTVTTTVRPADPATADLVLTAVAELNPRASGQGFTYTLRVTNDGPAMATGVQLTNDLPRGIALGPVTASQVNYDCSDTDPMLCTLGALPAGAEATVTIGVIRTEAVTLPNQATVSGEQLDPHTGNNSALTSALDLPTRQTTCDSKRCRLRLTCNVSDLLERRCDNQVTLFVDTRARRLSDKRAVRPPKLVRFAAVSRNFPGGQTEKVPLKLTAKGKKLTRKLVMQGKKKLRGGILQIRNALGGTDTIPLTLRLR